MKRLCKQNGSAMIVVLILVMVVIIMSSVLIFSVMSEIQMDKASEHKAAATYLAQAGIEHGLDLLEKNVPSSQYPAPSQQFTISSQNNEVRQYQISQIQMNPDGSGMVQAKGTVSVNGAVASQVTLQATIGTDKTVSVLSVG